MAGIGWNVENYWKWLHISGNGCNGWKELEMGENGWK